MKSSIMIAVLAIAMFVTVSCGNRTGNAGASSPTQSEVTVYYTCTMHPEIHSDKPGKCPKCGMELVKKETAEPDSTDLTAQPDSTISE